MKETIAAIASGMTASGIGIIRISGPDAFRILGRVFRFADAKKTIDTIKANTIHYGHILDGDGNVIDEVLVMVMKGPHTYTAEDTIEIDCHGGPFVMQKILTRVLRAGARAAEPGEFTKRAFLNGRIDLTEAEAVMDVIGSASEDALKSSLMQLGGSVKREIVNLRERILTELAFIEAALDDPEHYSLDGYSEELEEKLVFLMQEIKKLLSSFDEGKLIREGIFTVILGKPNAGKSSLLNYLTGEERAIVTDIAGTTRDSLEETVRLGGLLLRIADTAGIRSTGDLIERMGVERAKKLANQADLVLAVFDSSIPLDENDKEILSFISGRKSIVLLNKSDLEIIVDTDNIRKHTNSPVVVISAKMNEGRERIEDTIRDMFFKGHMRINEETMLTNVRHKEACEEALLSLEMVLTSIRDGMPEDLYAVDLMDAYTSLGYIIGEQVGDDLVEMVFAKFCMGK